MIGFDTNLLVRLIIEDDSVQWQMADDLLARCVRNDERCLISIPVLCETIWVLHRRYRASREDITLTIESLLDDPVFEIEHRQAVGASLQRFRDGKADFADYLISVKNTLLNATTTYTFDRALKDAEGFTWLGSKGS